MAMTLADARSKTALFVDDTTNVRFPVALIDAALKTALSRTYKEYVDNGGSRFEETATDQPDAQGEIDLSTYDPLEIRGVSILQSGYWFRLPAVDKNERGRTPGGVASYTLRTILVRNPVLPVDQAHPLVGIGAVALKSWDAFDNLVCLRAARELSLKDKEPRRDIALLEENYLEHVMKENPVVRHKAFPAPRSGYSTYIRWAYDYTTQKVEICEAVW